MDTNTEKFVASASTILALAADLGFSDGVLSLVDGTPALLTGSDHVSADLNRLQITIFAKTKIPVVVLAKSSIESQIHEESQSDGIATIRLRPASTTR